MAGSSHELSIIVLAKDLASRALMGVRAQIKGIESDARRAAGNVVKNLGKIAVSAGALAVTGFAYAAKQAGDFEAALRTINTIAGVSDSQLQSVGKGIRDLATSTGADLADLETGYYDLLSAGVAMKNGTLDQAAAQSALTAAVKLGRATLGTTSQAVDVLTTAINSYNLPASQATVISDQLAQAVQDGKTTLDQIAPVYAQLIPLAAQFGIKNDQVAAALGYLSAKGSLTADNVTNMRRAILELVKPTGPMAKMQKAMGVDFAKEVQNKGLVATLEEIRVAAKKAGVPFQELFGRIQGYQFALQVTGDNFDAFQAELEKVRKSTGLTDKQFEERQKGLNVQLAKLKAIGQSAAITIGNALLPKVTAVAEKLNGWIQSHGDVIDKIARAGAEYFDKLGTFLVNLPWGAIGSAAKLLGTGAKALLDAFLGLPSWVQTAVLTGWGFNKLTGGMAGSILGKVLGGATGGILSKWFPSLIKANIVNVSGAVVRTPGVPGGGLPVAGGAAAAEGGVLGGFTIAELAGISVSVAAFAAPLLSPYLFKGPAAPAGSLENKQTTEWTTTNQATGAKQKNVVPAGTGAQMIGLMPSFAKFAQEAGTAGATAAAKPMTALAHGYSQLQSTLDRAGQTFAHGYALLGSNVQQVRDAVTRQNPELAAISANTAKRTSVHVTTNANVTVRNYLSINDWQRKVVSSIRASAGSGGFI